MVKKIWYVTLLVVFGAINLAKAEESEADKIIAAQNVKLGDRPLKMVGMGLTQLMNDDYYIGAFYVDDAAQYDSAEDLAYLKAPRRMEFRFASERKVSGRGFGRKLAEGIKINNEAEYIKAEGENLRRFIGMFRGTYKKGDIVTVDYYKADSRTRISLNGRQLGVIDRSSDLYRMLVNVWVGGRPPSSKFRDGIMGQNENEYAIQLLRRFVSLK
ncbi:MAG: chalcone isomerase family protein [Kangiellaceae bacterium]|nr:chalcone isomerase family protein [Kangiellaceae bacterium]